MSIKNITDVVPRTRQEKFDHVVRSLVAQGGPAIHRHHRNECTYYNKDTGRSCAAGHLVPEPGALADGSWNVNNLGDVVGVVGDADLVLALQSAHDNASSNAPGDAWWRRQWVLNMRHLANAFALSPEVLDELATNDWIEKRATHAEGLLK